MRKIQDWHTAQKLLLTLLLFAFITLGLAGCGKRSPMQNLRSAEINKAVNPDESVIVFFTPKNHLRLHVPIVETDENGNLNFVTILVAGTKYLHRTTPGKHVYVLSSVRGRSEMLEANLEAGKVYYTYVSQHPKSRERDPKYYHAFEFLPVTQPTDATFTERMAQCRWFQNTHTAKDWYERNLRNLQKRVSEAQTRHREADEKKVIMPGYGVPTFVE